MTVSVSIVIPVHNGSELLRKLLASISCQTVQPLEVIVVDNGSSDQAREVACSMAARVIEMGRNTGFATAINRGIEEARGEGIALVNSDVELDSRWLEVLWSSACETGCSFVTGKILQAGARQTLDGAYDLICRGGCAWRAGAGRPASILRAREQVQFCSATAVIYRASVFSTVGVLEEAFDSYLEDVDLGLRCAAAGLAGWYLPDAVCWHQGSATFGRWNPHVVRLISRNQVFLIARHYSPALVWRWLWPIVVAQSLWGCLAVRHGCGFAWLRGKFEGLLRFASMQRQATSQPDLASIILDSERQIHRLQSETGFDAYWRVYFDLAGHR